MIIRKKTSGATKFALRHDKVKRIQNMIRLVALGALIALVNLGCSSTGLSNAALADSMFYMEKAHDGRIYVLGKASTAVAFETTPHVPLTSTHIGMGAKGETVICEVDKADPSMADRLWAEFQLRHHYYAEEEHNGRIYVLGSRKTHESFKQMHHLPLTYTVIGYGPKGETVIFEVDKDNPMLASRLQRTYDEKHRYYAEEIYDGRLYILGSEKSHEKFKQMHHLPLTHTLIGSGPSGETVIFEVDKENAMVAPRLMQQFSSRYGIEIN